MRKSALAGIVLAVVAAAVALWFLLDRERAPGGPQTRGGRVSEAEPLAEMEPPVRPPVPESQLVAPIRPAPFVDPDAPGTRAAVVDEPLRVLVLDDATGIPVPGAEVAWTDESRPPPVRGGVWGAPSTLVSDFDHAPQRTVADARGVAVVRTSPRLAVAARSGDRFGLRRFRDAPQPRGEIRLAIVAGPLVAARVVSESGVPVAGVPVTISMNLAKANSISNRAFYATSRGPDGLAIAHHPGVIEAFSQGDIKEVTAAIEGTGSGGRVKATSDELKAGPITLVMPQTGRVVVKVLDPEGKPFPSETTVSLAAERPSAPGWFFRREAKTNDGSAEFAMTPAGNLLTASAETAGFDTVTREKLDGPKGSGELVTIELRFQRRRAVVRGRAVDENGGPLFGAELQAELVQGDRMLILPAAIRLALDRRGDFSFEVDRGNPRLSMVDLMLELRDSLDAVEFHGRSRLPKLAADDETWLGEIRLSRVDTLASGVVIDDLGAPVAGALVIADAFRADYVEGHVISIGPRSLPNLTDVNRARTDESGAFQIQNRDLSGARITGFRLSAEMPGYVCPDRPEVDRAAVTGMKIVLQGTGTIEGRILLPDLAPVRRLTVQVTVSDCTPGCKTHYVFDDCVDSSGSFRLTGIQPGTAKVDVLMTGMAAPLTSVASVPVRRLATADDARLRAIDLRGHPALRP